MRVFVDPSASFHAIFGLLWVLFVIPLSGVDERFLSGGDTLPPCDFCDGGGDAGSGIVMTSGCFLGFKTVVGT